MPLSSRSLAPFLLPAALATAVLLAFAPASQASLGSSPGPAASDAPIELARGGGGGYGLGGGKSYDLDGGGKGSKAYDPYGKDDPYSTKASKGDSMYGGGGDGKGGHHKAVQQSFHGPNRDHMKVAHNKGDKQRGDGDDDGYDHKRNIDRDSDSPKVRGGTTSDDSSSGSGEDSQ